MTIQELIALLIQMPVQTKIKINDAEAFKIEVVPATEEAEPYINLVRF